jgi:hypothetical protein
MYGIAREVWIGVGIVGKMGKLPGHFAELCIAIRPETLVTLNAIAFFHFGDALVRGCSDTHLAIRHSFSP